MQLHTDKLLPCHRSRLYLLLIIASLRKGHSARLINQEESSLYDEINITSYFFFSHCHVHLT